MKSLWSKIVSFFWCDADVSCPSMLKDGVETFNRIEPVRSHRWKLCIDQFDASTVVNFGFPSIYDVNSTSSLAVIELVQSLDNDPMVDVLDWLRKKQKRQAEFLVYTSTGQVRQRWTMDLEPASVSFTSYFNHKCDDPVNILVVCECKLTSYNGMPLVQGSST